MGTIYGSFSCPGGIFLLLATRAPWGMLKIQEPDSCCSIILISIQWWLTLFYWLRTIFVCGMAVCRCVYRWKTLLLPVYLFYFAQPDPDLKRKTDFRFLFFDRDREIGTSSGNQNRFFCKQHLCRAKNPYQNWSAGNCYHNSLMNLM